MKASPTPGPYRLGNPSPHGTFNANMIYNEAELSVAQVYGIASHTTIEEAEASKRYDEGLATGRLLAASWELRDMLRAVIDNHCGNAKLFCSTCSPARKLLDRIDGVKP